MGDRRKSFLWQVQYSSIVIKSLSKTANKIVELGLGAEISPQMRYKLFRWRTEPIFLELGLARARRESRCNIGTNMGNITGAYSGLGLNATSPGNRHIGSFKSYLALGLETKRTIFLVNILPKCLPIPGNGFQRYLGTKGILNVPQILQYLHLFLWAVGHNRPSLSNQVLKREI